jgi:hypothetical protein
MADLTMFRWDGDNRLWDEVLSLIDAHVDSENMMACRAQQPDSERSFYCGGSNSLQDFKAHLMDLRKEANNPSGSVE